MRVDDLADAATAFWSAGGTVPPPATNTTVDALDGIASSAASRSASRLVEPPRVADDDDAAVDEERRRRHRVDEPRDVEVVGARVAPSSSTHADGSRPSSSDSTTRCTAWATSAGSDPLHEHGGAEPSSRRLQHRGERVTDPNRAAHVVDAKDPAPERDPERGRGERRVAALV